MLFLAMISLFAACSNNEHHGRRKMNPICPNDELCLHLAGQRDWRGIAQHFICGPRCSGRCRPSRVPIVGPLLPPYQPPSWRPNLVNLSIFEPNVSHPAQSHWWVTLASIDSKTERESGSTAHHPVSSPSSIVGGTMRIVGDTARPLYSPLCTCHWSHAVATCPHDVEWHTK